MQTHNPAPTSTPSIDRMQFLLIRAKSNWNNEDYEKALGLYSEAVELFSEAKHHAEPWTFRILWEEPGMDAVRGRAWCYFALSQYEECISDCDQLLELTLTIPNTWALRGMCYSRLGHYQQAIEDLTTAVELAPQYTDAYRERYRIYSHLGDFSRAIADVNHVLQIEPGSAEDLAKRAGLYLRHGAFAQAVADIRGYLNKNPQSQVAHSYLGFAYTKLGQIEQAQASITKSLEYCTAEIAKDPLNAKLYNSRAWDYATLGKNLDLGLEDANKAITLAEDADSCHTRGTIMALQGDFTSALESLSCAIELELEDALYYYDRAYVYRALGENELADQDLETAVQLDPQSKDEVPRSLLYGPTVQSLIDRAPDKGLTKQSVVVRGRPHRVTGSG